MIALNFSKKLILIGGTEYAGENKKAVFTLLNYILPGKGVMAMHCSANHAPNNPVDTAVFFGLSGTGKTTLSADPTRTLIGDDEHGWSDKGTFNFEGGCYAKTISLSPIAEPEIYATTSMFATVVENMVWDEDTMALDFEDDSLTPNMRCAYPLHYISNASETSLGGHPKNIIMLTSDAFGVLPPIARLTPAQAMYHFLSGFTSKVAGTEKGVVRSRADLLDLLRRPVHAAPPGGLRQPAAREDRQPRRHLLAGQHRLDRRPLRRRQPDADQGNPPPARRRARRLAASTPKFRKDPNFGFEVPLHVHDVPEVLLDPRRTWNDHAAYDEQAAKLVQMFAENFEQYVPLRRRRRESDHARRTARLSRGHDAEALPSVPRNVCAAGLAARAAVSVRQPRSAPRRTRLSPASASTTSIARRKVACGIRSCRRAPSQSPSQRRHDRRGRERQGGGVEHAGFADAR